MNRENSVGIHSSILFPQNAVMKPDSVSAIARQVGADFFVHMPGYPDFLTDKETYAQMEVKPKGVESSWWEDRAIEVITPLPHPASFKDKIMNFAVTAIFPPFSLSRGLTAKVLEANPDSYLIRRWPIVENPENQRMKVRNKIIELMSPKIAEDREVLDVHSLNLDLTSDQILGWQSQQEGRRLMISALDIDERLSAHGIMQDQQSQLVEPLIGHVSVVNLKLGALKGDQSMTEPEIVKAILEKDLDSLFGKRLRSLAERVGDKLKGGQIVDWIVKIKPSSLGGTSGLERVKNLDFAKEYIDFARKVITKV